jgi:hypothetical protein
MGQLKIFSDLTGNQTRELPSCDAVSHPIFFFLRTLSVLLCPNCPGFSSFFSLSLYCTTHNTNIHAPGGIRNRNPSKRSASDRHPTAPPPPPPPPRRKVILSIRQIHIKCFSYHSKKEGNSFQVSKVSDVMTTNKCKETNRKFRTVYWGRYSGMPDAHVHTYEYLSVCHPMLLHYIIVTVG